MSLSSADILFLRSLPRPIMAKHSVVIDNMQSKTLRARIERLQRARLIRVVVDAERAVGDPHSATVSLTDAGRAAIEQAPAR